MTLTLDPRWQQELQRQIMETPVHETVREATAPVTQEQQQAVQQASAEAERFKAECVLLQQTAKGVRRAYDAKTCTPEQLMFDVPCTAASANCLLIKRGQFNESKRKLREYLKNKPFGATVVSGDPTAAPLDPRVKAKWCLDVLREVAIALDATNVTPQFFLPWDIPEADAVDMAAPESFPYVRQWLASTKARIQESWTALGEPVIYFPIAPSLGGDTWSTPESMEPREVIAKKGAEQLKWIKGEQRFRAHGASAAIELVRIGQSAPGQPVPRNRGGRVVSNIAFDRTGDRIYGMSTLDFLTEEFRHINGYGFTDAQYATVPGPCQPSLFSDGCPDRDWHPALVPMPDTLIEYCAAWATDIISTELEQYVVRGVQNWLRQLIPFAATLNVPPEQVREMYGEMARAAAYDAEWQATTTGISAAFGALGFINVAFAIVAVVLQLVFTLFSKVLPVAAGWSCPFAPFKRSVADPQCDTSQIQGDGKVTEIRNVALPSLGIFTGLPTLLSFMDQPLNTNAPPPVLNPPPVLPNDWDAAAKKKVPWVGLGVAGAAIVGGAYTLRRLRG